MTTRTIMSVSALLTLAGAALANPVQGFYDDLPHCDTQGLRSAVEELGTGPAFPPDELILAAATFTNQMACHMSDDPNRINSLVVITNVSGSDWTDLFYVGDPDTLFSNYDGYGVSFAAPGVSGLAMRIDDTGVNRNLVFESMGANGVFEIGETWHFILQDWFSPGGMGPDAMGSLDFAGASFGDPFSTGSIVQFLVPAPGTAALIGFGGLGLLRRRRA